MKHLLLIRFSALGDILMTVPVIDALARQNPDLRITVVSKPFVQSVMEHLPENVEFYGLNPRDYPGLRGLCRLFKELDELKPTHVCDLHDVLRTKFCRLRWKLKGTPLSHIDKDRKARRRFIAQHGRTPQVTIFEKYAAAIRKLGFKVEIDPSRRFSFFPERKEKSGIGIAPFAAHAGKTYHRIFMEQVLEKLSKRGEKIYLFGAGYQEERQFKEWEEKYPGVKSMIGKLTNMYAECELMSHLRVMLTMDSGNMHLASLAGTRVVSVWGATHPFGGFLGWGQSLDDVVQKPLSCRPCSAFGEKKCKFGDYRCLIIDSDEIANRL